MVLVLSAKQSVTYKFRIDINLLRHLSMFGEKTTRVFSFVNESPDPLLFFRARADPLTQETLLAQVMRISSL